MAKRINNKMTFEAFSRKCLDFFETRRWYFMMSNPQILQKLPGNEMNITVWYFILEIRPKAHFILMYDWDTDDLPFSVYIDWKSGAFSHCFFDDGKLVYISDFADIDEALDNMCQEPTMYLANPTTKCIIEHVMEKGEDPDNTAGLEVGFMKSYSLLEAIEALEEYCKKHRELDDGHLAGVVHMPTLVSRTTMYEKRILNP